MHATTRLVSAWLLIGALGAGARALTAQDIGRETLPAGDGWAALGTGTTGGSDAAPDRVFR